MNLNILVVITNLLHIILSTSKVDSEITSVLVDAAVDLVTNFFTPNVNTLFVTLSSTSEQGLVREEDVLNVIRYRTQNGLLPFAIANNVTLRLSNDQFGNLFIVDSVESFLFLCKAITKPPYDAYGYVLVVLTMTRYDNEFLTEIFKFFFSLFFINVNVIVENPTTGSADMYTYFPVTSEHCFEIIPKLYNSYNGGRFEKDLSAYPEKFNNLYGCTINVVTFHFPPIMTLKKMQNGSYAVGGIEGNILHQLAKRVNFTYNLIDAKERGSFAPNGTSTGYYYQMLQGNGDLAICAFGYSTDRTKIMTASVIYYVTKFLFILPPCEEYTSFERLFLPFNYIIWSCISSIFIAAFALLTLLNLLSRPARDFLVSCSTKSPYLQMIVMFFGQGASKMPTRNFARSLFGIWLFAAMVLNTCYQAGLIKFLNNEAPKSWPRTVNGTLKLNFEVYAPFAYGRILEEDIKGLKVNPITKGYEYYLKKLQLGFKAIVLETEIQRLYFNEMNYMNGLLESVPEPLFSFPLTIYYKKDSYLRHPIDGMLLKFIASGLIKQWYTEYFEVLRDARLQYYRGLKFPKPFKLHKLKGSFQICAFGMALAGVVFVLEVSSVRFKWERLKRIITFYVD